MDRLQPAWSPGQQSLIGAAAGSGEAGVEAQGGAAWHHPGSGIHSAPARARYPHLAPGMGIGLAHGKVALPGQGLDPFTALIPNHHPCRHIGCAHQGGEGCGEVFAEAASCLKQKGIQSIALWEATGRQGVAESLPEEPLLGRLQSLFRFRQFLPMPAQLQQPGVEMFRQGEIAWFRWMFAPWHWGISAC